MSVLHGPCKTAAYRTEFDAVSGNLVRQVVLVRRSGPVGGGPSIECEAAATTIANVVDSTRLTAQRRAGISVPSRWEF